MHSKRWIHWAMLLVGNMIYALSVKLFLLPANLMSAGTTGIALVVNHMMGLPVSWFILAFNVAMLCLGWFVLGKKFAMTTCFSSLFYPIALEILNRTFEDARITDNMMLNVLFAGMGLGLSLGLVLRSGASTGGVDIPAVILKKYLNIPLSVSLWVFDFVIMVSQLLFHTAEDLLYGIVLLVGISITLNKVMLLGTSKTEVKIVSQHSEDIREAILSRVDRGVTILHGEGGYLHEDTEVILSIVSNHELPRIEQLARSIDPDCFMIISSVTEVWGRGFSYNKHHQQKKES
jgi:uncharacterized membrane-anchored protein YitT (DUF2179 family)